MLKYLLCGQFWQELLLSLLFLLAVAFCLIGSFSLWRITEFYSRLHIAVFINFSALFLMTLFYGASMLLLKGEFDWRLLLLWLFIFIITPINSFLLAKKPIRGAKITNKEL